MLSLVAGIFVPPGNAAEFLGAAWTPQQDRAALVHLPEGTKRLRLQTRATASAPWELAGIVHLDGRAGTLKMRLPDGVTLENVLLETSATDRTTARRVAARGQPLDHAGVIDRRADGDAHHHPVLALAGTPVGYMRLALAADRRRHDRLRQAPFATDVADDDLAADLALDCIGHRLPGFLAPAAVAVAKASDVALPTLAR